MGKPPFEELQVGLRIVAVLVKGVTESTVCALASAEGLL